ncbi:MULTISPECIES: hypothetical protein [unclassified Pseudomonas]|uniref:hypothetical protein n=1 Tax=unclassified Pseudomonas TaxID=196821 RepID=UPI0024484051|nr:MULTISPECIES: hypothetical protein [unclassified Pseudomonas]MDG9927735.1 hypothetical protein [Pseudomonas sp. GD04042]MDH0483167.1 hypothetical protein [Pseudomonas sp. GD04015]MDH0603967.1 hypothetical protein [Pseudomonas sp. GD03869]
MNPLSILRDSFYFFTRHLARIAPLCLPLIAAECLVRALVSAMVEPSHAPAYELLVGLFFYPLYSAALILYLDARSQGQRPALINLLAASLPLWPSLAVLTALSTLLIMLGGALFLPLALWLMVKLAFAEYLLVLRGLSPLQAMRESYALSVGHFWSLLACVLLVIVPLWLLDDWTLQLLGEQPDAIDGLLLDVINGFLQLFSSVVLFRCFMLCSPRPTEDSHSS